MTFLTDLDADLGNVFFDDYGVSALLVRAATPDAEPAAIRCIVGRGLDRFVDGGYIKNSWEVEFKGSDRPRTNDTVKVLDGSGQVAKQYQLLNQADRVGDVVIFAARVISNVSQ
jgi:hypothetical protein